MISRFARWYDDEPVAGDACLALALLLGVVVPTELPARGDAAGGVIFSALLLACVPLRRRAPVPTFVVVCLLCLAQLVLLERMVGGDFVALVALYTIVVHSPGLRLAVAATACMLVGSVLVAVRWDTPDGGASVAVVAVSTVGAVVLAATLGAWRRSRRTELAALQERNRLLALERDQQAAVGAAIERARIARELHDVIAWRSSARPTTGAPRSRRSRSPPPTSCSWTCACRASTGSRPPSGCSPTRAPTAAPRR